MKPYSLPLFLRSLLLMPFLLVACEASNQALTVPFPDAHYEQGLDGRLILLISEDDKSEPRFQLTDDPRTCQAFGMDVENWNPDELVSFDLDAFGYPIENFDQIPAGEYTVQLVFSQVRNL